MKRNANSKQSVLNNWLNLKKHKNDECGSSQSASNDVDNNESSLSFSSAAKLAAPAGSASAGLETEIQEIPAPQNDAITVTVRKLRKKLAQWR